MHRKLNGITYGQIVSKEPTRTILEIENRLSKIRNQTNVCTETPTSQEESFVANYTNN